MAMRYDQMGISSRLILAGLVLAGCLLLGTTPAQAVCDVPLGGFAIFQCADFAYFEPAPFPVTFDPNLHPTNVQSVFWQIGFGNRTYNTGTSTSGTGMLAFGNFGGNDSGLWELDIVNAHSVYFGFPPNSLCLRSNNWANQGIDGCCDNPRSATQLLADDNILNPYYDVYYARMGYPGYYSTDWIQDMPMGILLQGSGEYDEWFSIAMASTKDRGSNGVTTDTGANNDYCTSPPANPAVCDIQHGWFDFGKIAVNALPNLLTGADNVVPWQRIPRPLSEHEAENPGIGLPDSPIPPDWGLLTLSWDPIPIAHDGREIASTNPEMGGAEFPAGAGVVDLLGKVDNPEYNGLVRFDVESATVERTNLDPDGNLITSSLVFTTVIAGIPQPTSDVTGDPLGDPIMVEMFDPTEPVPEDTCWRVRVHFGKTPSPVTPNVTDCRVGRCGDIGYTVATIDPGSLTCVGGPLLGPTRGKYKHGR